MRLPFQADRFSFKDLGGEHIARYVGDCVVCGSRVFSVDQGDPDPRGALGERHSASRLVADEYSASGADVPLCFDCANTREKHEQGLLIARRQWKAVAA